MGLVLVIHNSIRLHGTTWTAGVMGSRLQGPSNIILINLWPKKGKGVKAKVAHLTWDSAYGRAANEPTKRHGEKTGKYEVVAERFCTMMPTDPEIMGFLSDFEKKDVDIIWSNSIVQTPAVIMKGIHKLGLAGKMVHMANLWAPADQLLDDCGSWIGEGYMCPQPVFVPAADPNEPASNSPRCSMTNIAKSQHCPISSICVGSG